MKIVHVTLYPPRDEKHVSGSGVTGYSKNLVTHVPSGADDTVHILCDRIDGKTETYEENGVSIHRCFDRGMRFAWQLHQELKRLQPDVVHIQQELALFGGVVSAVLLQFLVLAWRHKTVITLHGVVDPRAIDRDFVRQNNSRAPVLLVRTAFRIIFTPLARLPRHIIVHEPQFKTVLAERYGAKPDNISVIPHGVEDLRTGDMAAARRKLSIPENAQVALFMGYATGYKGLDLLIEGFARYAQHNDHAVLLIGAGKHPKLYSSPAYLAEYYRLQHKAAQLIPPNQYRWAGFIDETEIADYYSASDVSLYPYTVAMSSSGPMSFAIGFEKPFLASSAFAGIFVGHPQLMFDRTSEALAAKLGHFFTHQEQYQGISQTLKQQRGWAAVGEQTAQVYQAITSDTKEEQHAEEESAIAG